MKKILNPAKLATSAILAFVLTAVIELVVLLQAANIFTLESMIVLTLTLRLAMFAGPSPLSLAMPGLPTRDMIRHHAGSALHWIVAVTAGLVFSVFLGTSLIASFTSPGTNYNLNNALTVFITTPLTAVVFVALTLLFYWLLKRY